MYSYVMDLFRENYKRLVVIAGIYYRGFKNFKLFTKIFVIFGILLFELMLFSSGGIFGNTLMGIFTIHFLTISPLLILTNYKIELDKNQKLSDGEKAALNSEQINVYTIETLGRPVPESLRPQEIKKRGLFDILRWREIKE